MCWGVQDEAVAAWLAGLGASEATLASFRKRDLHQPIHVAVAEANRVALMEALHMSEQQARRIPGNACKCGA